MAVENFHVLADRQTADRPSTPGRVNLLTWDGNGTPDGMFPPSNLGPIRTTSRGGGKAGGGKADATDGSGKEEKS